MNISLPYLCKILIHGARAAMLRIKRDRAPIGPGLDALNARVPKKVVVVAMVDKRRGYRGFEGESFDLQQHAAWVVKQVLVKVDLLADGFVALVFDGATRAHPSSFLRFVVSVTRDRYQAQTGVTVARLAHTLCR